MFLNCEEMEGNSSTPFNVSSENVQHFMLPKPGGLRKESEDDILQMLLIDIFSTLGLITFAFFFIF